MEESTKEKGLTSLLDSRFLKARSFPFGWPSSSLLPTEADGSLPDRNTGPHIMKNQRPACAAPFTSAIALAASSPGN